MLLRSGKRWQAGWGDNRGNPPSSGPAGMTDPRHDPSRVVRAPRGTTLHCRSWLTEAAYRMIQNNL
ncbi:MAG: hypothetical protein C0P65_005730, partial [Lysobacteraceae bacterium]